MRALLLVALSLAACTGASSTGQLEGVCALDAECDDGVACTRDRCGDGACRHEPEPLACDDGNACTRDACHPEKGCLNLPDREGQTCDDHDGCTTGDVCAGGACGGQAVSCDDDDACTLDGCDPVAGACTHGAAPDGAACDDGDACTTGEACLAGACAGGAEVCACREAVDCAALDDDDACNGTLTCVEHACVVDPASVVTCEAASDTACRKTVCAKATGACVALDVHEGQECPPTEPCALTGRCVLGACEATSWRACDDGDPCTVEACEPETGQCRTEPADVGTACDDGDPCTRLDTCVEGGACEGGDPLPCTDGNACTVDLCQSSTGLCVFAAKPDQSDCDDADPCTLGDACDAGACAPGAPIDGCCHDDAECPAAGPCGTVVCGAAHTCDVTQAPDCCGNGLLEAGEACDPAAADALEGCGVACGLGVFDVDTGVAGSVQYAAVTSRGSTGGFRAAVTVIDSGAGADDGLHLVDLTSGGARLGAPVKLDAGPALAPQLVVVPAQGQGTRFPHETTQVTWLAPPDYVRSQLVVGAANVLAYGQNLFSFFEWHVDPPALDRAGLGRLVASGHVEGALYEGLPVLGYATSALEPAGAPEVEPEGPLLLTRGEPDGGGCFTHPEHTALYARASHLLPRFYDEDYVGVEARQPAFVTLGVYDRLVYVVSEDHGPDERSVRLVMEALEGDTCLGPAAVLWTLEGSSFYPFAPAVVAGADASYALIVFPVQTPAELLAPPLALLRVGYDGALAVPLPVLPEKTTLSVRHEAVRLGPDRVALVYDVIEAPDGVAVESTMRVGLSYAVLDEQGATVVPPTEIVAPTGRRVPEFVVLPHPAGGFVVFFVEREQGIGRLRARFVQGS